MTQIFIEPELENLSELENSTEWQLVCEQLGLSNQLSRTEKSETKQAPPYMAIDPKTAKIIRTLCPEMVDFRKYAASTIPLDVLQEIQKCVKHGWYDQIHIYYDNVTPDPFVVGSYEETQYRYHFHLIARWGAEMLPMEMLEQKAIQRLKNAALKSLHELSSKVDYAIRNTDNFISGILGNADRPALDFHARGLDRGYNYPALPNAPFVAPVSPIASVPDNDFDIPF